MDRHLPEGNLDVQPFLPQQRGFSLIEVMVANFVLSVGLLGVAGLQLASLRDNTDALLRTRAVVLATDIIERMRTNTDGLSSYAVSWAGDGMMHGCQKTNDTSATACSSQQLGEDDIYAWKRIISDFDDSGAEPPTGLPGGTGQITIATDSVTGLSTITVSLRWQEGEDSPTFSTMTQL